MWPKGEMVIYRRLGPPPECKNSIEGKVCFIWPIGKLLRLLPQKMQLNIVIMAFKIKNYLESKRAV